MATRHKPMHSQQEWLNHVNLIARLHLDAGLGYDEIAAHLFQVGFDTTPRSVKERLLKWKITKDRFHREPEILARWLVQNQLQDQTVVFKRCGEVYPSDPVYDFIKANPSLQGSPDPLPVYFEVENGTAMPVVDPGEQVQQRSSEEHLSDGSNRPSLQHERHSGRQVRQAQPPERATTSTSRYTLPRRPRQNEHKGDEEEGNDDAGKDQDNDSNSDVVLLNRRKRQLEKAIAQIDALDFGGTAPDQGTIRARELLKSSLKSTMHDQSMAERGLERTDMGPLHWAAARGNVPVLEFLLEQGAKINARGGFGYTALHLAAIYKNFDALKSLLLAKGSSEPMDINAVAQTSSTALHCAIESDSLECALLLVINGADVDVLDQDKETALHLACRKPQMLPLIKAMAEKTGQINTQNDSGRTALHLALADDQNEEYARTLIEAGASLNVPDSSGRTPMHQACFTHSVEFLLYMLTKDVDLTVAAHEGETILHLVCQRDIPEVLEAVLREKEVNLNAKTHFGVTPLILAASNNAYDSVRMLVERGADTTCADADHDTAIIAAVKNGYTEIAKFLILNDSPLNPQNQSLKQHKARIISDRKVQQAIGVPPTLNKTAADTQWQQEAEVEVVASSSNHMTSDENRDLRRLLSKFFERGTIPGSLNSPTSRMGPGVVGGFPFEASFMNDNSAGITRFKNSSYYPPGSVLPMGGPFPGFEMNFGPNQDAMMEGFDDLL